jgi:tetratricopeptide (TPR) repeat protein
MKKLAILMMLMICSNSFSQKKELRQIKKLVSEKFFEEALSSLDEINGIVQTSDDKIKAEYYYNRAVSERETDQFSNSINSYNSLIKIDDSNYSTTIKLEIDNLKILIENAIVNSAVEDNKIENYESSMKKLYLAYDFNGNEEYLYYAAGSAVNSKNYDNAIEYYLLLKNNGYTGVVDEYFITNNESGVEEKVSETEFEVFKGSKDYSNPRIGQTESRYPEIIKNIALLYVVQKKIDLAISAIDEARKAQPDDVNLILNDFLL